MIKKYLVLLTIIMFVASGCELPEGDNNVSPTPTQEVNNYV